MSDFKNYLSAALKNSFQIKAWPIYRRHIVGIPRIKFENYAEFGRQDHFSRLLLSGLSGGRYFFGMGGNGLQAM